MNNKNYSYRFTSKKTPSEIFHLLLDIPQWWFGLFDETITGAAQKVGDEFRFEAGGGMHTTTQKLVELLPNKKIVWLVTKSQLTFLSDPGEWEGTRICFELQDQGSGTEIVFRHEGLLPEIECYANCSTAWTGYLDRLKKKLN